MYKIDVYSAGNYGNVMLGPRYVFSKRKAKKVIMNFIENDCCIVVLKFVKCGDTWQWSNDHDLYGGIWESEDKK